MTELSVTELLEWVFTREEKITYPSVRDLSFKKFNENVICKVTEGISLDDFEPLVNRIAARLNIPDDVKGEVLDGVIGSRSQTYTKSFKFEKGKDSMFRFGLVGTTKRPRNKVDLAYSIYQLDFKLSPADVVTEETKKFLLYTYSKIVDLDTRETDLSEAEQDKLEAYFKDKAIAGFRNTTGSNALGPPQ